MSHRCSARSQSCAPPPVAIARRLQSRQHVAFDASRPSFERRKYSHDPGLERLELVGRYAEPAIGYGALTGRASADGTRALSARRIAAAPAGSTLAPVMVAPRCLRLAGATTLRGRSGSGLPACGRLQGWTDASRRERFCRERGAIAPTHVSHCEACGTTPLAGSGAAAGTSGCPRPRRIVGSSHHSGPRAAARLGAQARSIPLDARFHLKTAARRTADEPFSTENRGASAWLIVVNFLLLARIGRITRAYARTTLYGWGA